MAHITGGGLPENLPRCLGDGQAVSIQTDSWTIPPLFQWLETLGQVDRLEMFNTFNMGVGFVAIAPADQAQAIIDRLSTHDISAWVIGEIIPNAGEPLVFA